MRHTNWIERIAAAATTLAVLALAPGAQANELNLEEGTIPGVTSGGSQDSQSDKSSDNAEGAEEGSTQTARATGKSDQSNSGRSSDQGLDLTSSTSDEDSALAAFNQARNENDSSEGSGGHSSEGSQGIGGLETGNDEHSCSPWPSCSKADLGSKEGVESEPFRRVAVENNDEIQACYADALEENAELSGQVVLTFTISADGSPKKISVESSSLGDDDVAECAVEKVDEWNFPRPSDYGYESLKVTHPYTFESN